MTVPSPPPTLARISSETIRRRAASALIAATGLLHLVLVPEYLVEAPVIGVLFALAVPLSGAVAWTLWRTDDVKGWAAGIALAFGMTAGFVLSRTVGLVGYTSNDWAEGIPSLAVQIAFLVLAAAGLWSLRTRSSRAAR